MAHFIIASPVNLELLKRGAKSLSILKLPVLQLATADDTLDKKICFHKQLTDKEVLRF